MGDHRAFFYGTLMASQVLYRVCYGTTSPVSPSPLTILPALLPYYCRHKVLNADYPAITPSSLPSASVRGTLVSGLTDGDMWRLDIFEGQEYERRKVKVRVLDEGVGDGEDIEVDTYVWVAEEERLEEGEWDFAVFTKEKMGRWVAENEEYDEVDQAVKAGAPDPTGGRGRGGGITERLTSGGEKEKDILESAV